MYNNFDCNGSNARSYYREGCRKNTNSNYCNICHSNNCCCKVGPPGPMGPAGPMGPTGPMGPAGEAATIQGYYDDYDEFIAAHPTGTPGEMYIVDGILYVWDEQNQMWNALGSLVGPEGPAGPAGEAATIQGYYDDYNDFITAHPTGTVGEMYIVEGILYVWDEENQTWNALGSLVGPEGPAGPAGTAATIQGYYDDYNDFITAHPTGTVGEMYIVEGILYVWDEENQTWNALGSLVGPEGPAGEAATIQGYYDDYNDFITAHPTGTVGEMYIVEGILYVWDEENQTWNALGSLVGPEGPEGPAGSDATAITIIPFASQQAPYVSTNNGGSPTSAALIGFGYLPDATLRVTIDPNDRSFNLSGTPNRQVAFSLPFDMRLNSIYITVGNYDEFILPPSGTLVYPFVQIYAAEAGTNSFFPITDAFAIPEDGIDPYSAAEATMREASTEGLDIGLRAGTRIAICGMMEITGDTMGRQYYLYYTGGIGMTRWVE